MANSKALQWSAVLELAGSDRVLEGYTLCPGDKPSTVPTKTLPTLKETRSDKPVLLYRDGNGWCPYCERVWFALEEKNIPYDSVLINLRDKPAWYQEVIPTTLTPGVILTDGSIVWDSLSILKRLEELFPQPSLLPTGVPNGISVEKSLGSNASESGAGDQAGSGGSPALGKAPSSQQAAAAVAWELAEQSDALIRPGYQWLAGSAEVRQKVAQDQLPDSDKLEQLRSAFVKSLETLEGWLERSGGPFFLGPELSVVDIAMAPGFERLSANLTHMRSYDPRARAELPRLASWYRALLARPAYQKVRVDDQTMQMLTSRVMGMAGPAPPVDPTSLPRWEARAEAAAKMALNHQEIIKDVMRNSGVAKLRILRTTVAASTAQPAAPTTIDAIATAAATIATTDPVTVPPVNQEGVGGADEVEEVLESALRRIATYLVTGDPGPPLVRRLASAGPAKTPDPGADAAITAAVVAFFRNRASSPRDMTANAVEELREAGLAVLKALY